MNPEYIAIIAALCTTGAFIPQAVKVLRERETQAISLGMYVTFSAGVAMWLTYGVLVGSPAIIAGNAVTLSLALVILWMKIRCG